MPGGPAGIGRRGNLGAIDQQPVVSKEDWNAVRPTTDISITTDDLVPRLLWDLLGATSAPAAITGFNLVANRLYVQPFMVGAPRPLTRLGIHTTDGHTVGSQAIRGCIFRDGGQCFPSGKVFDPGSVPGVGQSGSGTGLIKLATAVDVLLDTGIYWAGFMVNAQWVTDTRTLNGFSCGRFPLGMAFADVPGNANSPGPALSSLVGWYADIGSFTIPDPFPAAALSVPVFQANGLGSPAMPAMFGGWGQ